MSRTGSAPRSKIAPLDAAFASIGHLDLVFVVVMDHQDKCPQCGAIYHRAPAVSFLCVVCATHLRTPDSPTYNVPEGRALASVPGCETIISSLSRTGANKK